MAREYKITAKQERFARLIFEGITQRDAYVQAGYSQRQGQAVIDRNASVLANSNKLLKRLAELRKAAMDASVATVVERKQILSEISRGRVADFVVNPTKEKLRSAALQEFTVIEGKSEKKTTIKLHNPIQAIAELNKMEKIYTEGGTVTIDNRSINITVATPESKELIERLLAGEEPKLELEEGGSAK